MALIAHQHQSTDIDESDSRQVTGGGKNELIEDSRQDDVVAL